MTFKHSKFEDSVTMRSLERIAKENGWVKADPITKSASSKVDLTPSTSLFENVVKLCDGLRAAGFDKYAVELETKLLSCKQAQTLYEVNKEKGEDLVDAAHPKGSHKLENVEGDEAVFETIVDRHLKMLDKIEKMPTGKLASAKDIIHSVKVALAQASDPKSLLNSASNLVQQGLAVAKKAGGLTDIVMSWALGRGAVINSVAAKDDLTLNDIKSAEDALSALLRNLHPSALHNYLPDVLTKGISDDAVWARVEGLFEGAMKNIKSAEEAVTTQAAFPQQQTSKVTTLPEYQATGPLTDLYRRVGVLKQKLNSYKAMGPISSNATATAWINEELGNLQDLTDRMGKVPDEKEEEMAKVLNKELISYESEVTQFYTQWVQPKA